jgi:hypothetical protein
MQVDLMPTLIDMYRETFEGEVRPGWVWIVSGPAEGSVLGSLSQLTAEKAYKEPSPGRKSIAAHAAHLRYALDLTLQRLNGENPPADWPGSFNVGQPSPAAWEELQRDLRKAYDGVLAFYDRLRDTPIEQWPPIQAVGLSAMIGHNAYHLGAIRQLMLDVRG